jgi:hypothetical protein
MDTSMQRNPTKLFDAQGLSASCRSQLQLLGCRVYATEVHLSSKPALRGDGSSTR